jgi:hypothetical protein
VDKPRLKDFKDSGVPVLQVINAADVPKRRARAYRENFVVLLPIVDQAKGSQNPGPHDRPTRSGRPKQDNVDWIAVPSSLRPQACLGDKAVVGRVRKVFDAAQPSGFPLDGEGASIFGDLPLLGGPRRNFHDHVHGGTPCGCRCYFEEVCPRTSAGLNADQGWAGPPNQSVTLPVETPFRLRFEVETPPSAPFVERFRLQYRRNGGQWRPVLAADFPYAPSEVTPRVSVVSTSAYNHLADATDLLDGSAASYAGGKGMRLSGQGPALPDHGVQSEWEWPVVIRRYADGAVTNEAGDRFEFRLVDVKGRPVPASTRPTITATVPPRLLGGTFPETPGRLGPWETSGGSLYFLMEPAESYNKLMTVKSADGGQTWGEVDSPRRPETGDLEGFASAIHNGTIHMLHQIDAGVLHHSFRTTDHPSNPDTWDVRDDTVATPGEPPVQVTSLTARPDGSLVGTYGGPSRIHYKIRSPDGTWGPETTIPSPTGGALSGPQTTLGAGGTVHLAYTRRDGTGWHRRIRQDGSLSPPAQVTSDLGTAETDIGSILPLVHLPESNATVILYRRASGRIWARRTAENGALDSPAEVTERPVVQNAVDSDQVGADAVAIDASVHVLFIEEGTGRLYHTSSPRRGEWRTATVQVDSANAQWVRGRPLRQGSQTASAYGFVYDAGSDGGSGMNWYREVPVSQLRDGIAGTLLFHMRTIRLSLTSLRVHFSPQSIGALPITRRRLVGIRRLWRPESGNSVPTEGLFCDLLFGQVLPTERSGP